MPDSRPRVNSATGETAYHFIGGKAVRGPSSTASSPHTMQSPGRVSRRPSDTTSAHTMQSPVHVLRRPSGTISPHTMQSPVHVSRRPSDTTSPYAMHSPGHAAPWTAGAPAMHSPAGYVAPPMHHSPSPAGFAAHAVHSPAPVVHSPAPVVHSPAPAGFSGPAMNHPAPGVPYYHQPGYGGGVPAGDPTPTAAGEAVGYRSSKRYVRPRSKTSRVWTQP